MWAGQGPEERCGKRAMPDKPLRGCTGLSLGEAGRRVGLAGYQQTRMHRGAELRQDSRLALHARRWLAAWLLSGDCAAHLAKRQRRVVCRQRRGLREQRVAAALLLRRTPAAPAHADLPGKAKLQGPTITTQGLCRRSIERNATRACTHPPPCSTAKQQAAPQCAHCAPPHIVQLHNQPLVASVIKRGQHDGAGAQGAVHHPCVVTVGQGLQGSPGDGPAGVAACVGRHVGREVALFSFKKAGLPFECSCLGAACTACQVDAGAQGGPMQCRSRQRSGPWRPFPTPARCCTASHAALPEHTCAVAHRAVLPAKQPAQPDAAGLLRRGVERQRRQALPLEHHPQRVLRLCRALQAGTEEAPLSACMQRLAACGGAGWRSAP